VKLHVVTRSQRGFLLPLLAAIIAGAGVAGGSLALDSTSSSTRSTSTTVVSPSTGVPSRGAPAALALQGAIVKVVRSVSPVVVQIEDQQGLGSGIVLDAAGDIVTNNHVVRGASSFMVTTSNGARFRARLVGSFPPDDLAVIKVSGAHLQPATFADSSKLAVGDLAIAIGNPLGLRSSVTEGIVSGFRQAVPEEGNVTLPSVIQTSAAINPGNSGGALVDIEGRVIGIPTLAAIDPQLGGGSAPGIGFAIPSNLARDIAGQIIANGEVVDSHRALSRHSRRRHERERRLRRVGHGGRRCGEGGRASRRCDRVRGRRSDPDHRCAFSRTRRVEAGPHDPDGRQASGRHQDRVEGKARHLPRRLIKAPAEPFPSIGAIALQTPHIPWARHNSTGRRRVATGC
jgi:putative serine protease PepD